MINVQCSNVTDYQLNIDYCLLIVEYFPINPVLLLTDLQKRDKTQTKERPKRGKAERKERDRLSFVCVISLSVLCLAILNI
jgi:hypothetical protein